MSEIEWENNIRLLHNNTWLTITPHYVNVRLPLTEEPFSAEIRWVDNGKVGNTISPDPIYSGNTIEIYARTVGASNWNLLFRGKVEKIGEEYTGMFKEKGERYIQAYGYGYELMKNYKAGKISSGFAYNVFNTIASELKSKDLIDGYTITYIANPRVKGQRESSTYWDLLRSVAEQADWDFYVDNSRTLRIFSRRAFTISTVIQPDFRAKIEWDSTNLINSIEVWGAATLTFPSNYEELTEDTLNWNGTNFTRDTIYVKKGEYSFKASTINASPYLERTFTPSTDIFLRGGRIHFWSRAKCNGVSTDVKGGSIRIILYSDDTNYFYKDVGIPGGRIALPSYGVSTIWISKWTENFINFNQYDPEGWNQVGSPVWSNIYKMKIELIHPIGTGVNHFIVDDMYISDIQLKSMFYDGESISKYGLRSRPPVKDGLIPTKEVADAISSLLVTMYKNPRLLIENVEMDAHKMFNLELGAEATVSIYNKSIATEIREIEYIFEGKDFRGRVSLADRYVPKIERAFQIATALLDKLNWNVEKFWKIMGDQVFIDIPVEPLEIERIAKRFNLDLEMSLRRVSLLSEDQSVWEQGGWNTSTFGINAWDGTVIIVGDGNASPYFWAYHTSWSNTDIYFKARIKHDHTSDLSSTFLTTLSHDWLFVWGVGHVAGSPCIGFQFEHLSPPESNSLLLKGVYRPDSNVGYTISLDTLSYGNYHLYEIKYKPKESVIEYYLDSELKGTIDIGSDTLDTEIKPFGLMVDVKNTSPSNHTLSFNIRGIILASPWEEIP